MSLSNLQDLSQHCPWTLQEFSSHTHEEGAGREQMLKFRDLYLKHIQKDFFFLSSLTISNYRVTKAKCWRGQNSECRRWETHSCVSTLQCDLQKSLISPAQVPSACHQAYSHQPAQRFASNQIFYFLCQAAAISHFSSDLDGPNVGIHYHTTLFASSLCSFFSPVMDPQRLPPGPPAPCLVCAPPAWGSSSALVPFTVVKRLSLNVCTQNKRQKVQCNGLRSQ